jgi:hypothetical protein
MEFCANAAQSHLRLTCSGDGRCYPFRRSIEIRPEDIVAGKRKRGSEAKRDASSQPSRPEPEREHEDAEVLIPGAERDDLAEELGEESVEAATSGQSSAEDNLNAEVPEETGGPFVETAGGTEFGYGTDPRDRPPAVPRTRRRK